MTFPYYRVHLRVGPYSWDRESTDDPGYGITAPVKIGWSIPEDKPWPAHPNPIEAEFSLIVATTADVPLLDIGAEVSLRVFIDPDGAFIWPDVFGSAIPAEPIAWFAGRVAEVDASPHPLGMLYRINAVDYTVDLQEQLAGQVAYPQEFTRARIDRIAAELGIPSPWSGTVLDPAALTVLARDASPTPGRDIIVEHLDQVQDQGIVGELEGGQKWFLVPNLDEDTVAHTYTLNAALPFKLVYAAKRSVVGWNNFPAAFINGASGWRPEVDADTVTGVPSIPDLPPAYIGTIDAADLLGLEAAHWTRLKGDAIDTVTVTAAGVTVTEQHSSPVPVRYSLDTTLANGFDAAGLAEFLLPPEGEPRLWSVDEFVLLDSAPDYVTLLKRWFGTPDGGLAFLAGPPVIAVDNIPAAQNPHPNPDPWYAGVLDSCSITLENRHYRHRFRLKSLIPRAELKTTLATAEYLSPAAIAAAPAWATITYDDLDPAYSHYDYRLVRKLI